MLYLIYILDLKYACSILITPQIMNPAKYETLVLTHRSDRCHAFLWLFALAGPHRCSLQALTIHPQRSRPLWWPQRRREKKGHAERSLQPVVKGMQNTKVTVERTNPWWSSKYINCQSLLSPSFESKISPGTRYWMYIVFILFYVCIL